jgi:hypothetical protein
VLVNGGVAGGEVMEEVREAVLQLVVLGVEALVEHVEYELQVGVHGAASLRR